MRWARDAGIVDQDVDVGGLRTDGLHCGGEGGGRGDVGLYWDNAMAEV